MTLDLAQLRRLAEESRTANAWKLDPKSGNKTLDIDAAHDSGLRFSKAATEDVVLELLDRLERAEQKLAERDAVYPTLMTQVGKEQKT